MISHLTITLRNSLLWKCRKEMDMYLSKDVSKISGVSVRTLHYYDQIGLLSPQKKENGYRYYTEKDIDILQHILFFKKAGVSLKRIKTILTDDDASKLFLLEKQLGELRNQEHNLKKVISTLDKTIKAIKGEVKMTISEKFEGLKYENTFEYKQEAIEKYGKNVIDKTLEKQKGKEKEIADKFNSVFFGLAECLNQKIPVSDNTAQQHAESLLMYLRKYAFDCSLDAFKGIGINYVEDERFKENLDKFGIGVAEYTRDTIVFYVNKNR